MSPAHDRDARRTLRGSAANYLAALFQMGLLLFHVLAARLFGQAAYGAYVFAWSLIEMGGKVALVGMDKGMLRGVAVARARNDPNEEALVLATGFKVASLCSLLMIAALWFVASIEQWPAYRTAIRSLSPVVLTWSLSLVFVAATMATKTMRYNLVVRGIAEPALMLVSVIGLGLALPSLGERGPPLAHLIASTLTAALSVWALGRRFDRRPLMREFGSRSLDRALVRFTVPVMLAEVLNQAIYRLDIVILGWYARDPRDVASYGAAVLLAGAISSVRYAFDPILSPLVAESLTHGDGTRLATNLRRMTRWVTALALPLFATLLVFGDAWLTLWGREFAQAWTALVILSVAHLVNAVLGLHQWPVVMSGRSRLDLWNNVAGFLVILALNLALIPRLGLVGAAIATLSGNLVFRGLQVAEVRLLFSTLALDGPVARLVACGALCVTTQAAVRALTSPLHPGFLALAILAGLVVYGVAAWRVGLTAEDRELVRLLIARARGGDETDAKTGSRVNP